MLWPLGGRFDGLPDYIRELKAEGIRFVTILDPCISTGEPPGYRPYELGNQMDVWVKKSDGTPVVGRVWPDSPIYFADYSKPETKVGMRLIQESKMLRKEQMKNVLQHQGMVEDFDQGVPRPPGVRRLVDRHERARQLHHRRRE